MPLADDEVTVYKVATYTAYLYRQVHKGVTRTYYTIKYYRR